MQTFRREPGVSAGNPLDTAVEMFGKVLIIIIRPDYRSDLISGRCAKADSVFFRLLKVLKLCNFPLSRLSQGL